MPMPKQISVGGTSMCSNVPLMLSLPPIAPSPKPICAYSAPRSAERGCPQRSGSLLRRMKNSCSDSLTVSTDTPLATSFDAAVKMEWIAPTNGESSSSCGEQPNADTVTVSVSPLTGGFAAITLAGVN